MAENLRRLQDDLDCSICKDMFKDPVALPECQHVYCRQCVQSLLDTSREQEQRPRCPECRCLINPRASLRGAYRLRAIVKKIEAEKRLLKCEVHGQSYSLFCQTCHHLVCKGCVREHDRHSLRDIEEETTSEKRIMAEKVQDCEDERKRLLACRVNCVELGTSIKRESRLRSYEIQKAFDKALIELKTWKTLADKEVAQLEGDRMSSHDDILGLLNHTQKEIDNIIAPSRSLLSAPDHQFLKDSFQLRTGLDSGLETWRKVFKGIEKDLQGLGQSVEAESVTPRYLRVMECSTDQKSAELTTPKHLALMESMSAEDTHTMTTGARAWGCSSPGDPVTERPSEEQTILTPPQMVFSKVSDKRLQICGEGIELVWTDIVPFQSYEAWTSAELKATCFYWEVTFSVRYGPRLERGWGYAAGVAHPGSGLRDNPGRNSWYVGISYTNEGVSYYSCDSNSRVREPYRETQLRVGPRRLGLYMDCPGKTLAIVDPVENQIVCTLGNVDVSRPLIPAVRFLTTCSTPRRMSAHLASDTLENIPAIVRGFYDCLRY